MSAPPPFPQQPQQPPPGQTPGIQGPPAGPPPEQLPPPIDLYGILAEAEPDVRRERTRPPGLALTVEERDTIVGRVRQFADAADDARADDLDARIQRHAKLMQWATERDSPWEGAHPMSSPDILTAVLRSEDTLQNAVMSQRPVMNAAAQDPANKEREHSVERYQDHQFFVKQRGEKLIESLSCDFIREGDAVTYVHQVRETRSTVQVRTFSPIPAGTRPRDYFEGILRKRWTEMRQMKAVDDEGWTWTVWETPPDAMNPKRYDVEFYTRPVSDPQGPAVEMVIKTDLVTFNGPLVERIPYERLLYPVDCENLQCPSPSNPTGAAFVIVVDYPKVDEVRRLAADGTYDLLDVADVDNHIASGKGAPVGGAGSRAPVLADAKLDMRNMDPAPRRPRYDARNHGCVTRLRCYDTWVRDEDGGPSLDVIWTVIEDMQMLARARHLGEEMPGNPPRRPFAEGAMIPIPGQRSGLGIPEIMEASHDWEVKVKEQLVDGSDIEIVPAFAYRQSASINPLQYRMAPGLGMPESQPNDIRPLQLGGRTGPVALNQLALIKQDREGLVSIGDLQLGKIPTGKSSALRTSSGIQQVLAQGEARPERILRRFFMLLRDTWSLMYQLNRHYVDVEDTVRTVGASKPDEDPWLTVSREDFSGTMDFDFTANVLNTGRLQLQESLEKALGILLNPFLVQLGITTPDTIYRAFHDWLAALGQTPEKYLHAPTPAAGQNLILAAQALHEIMSGTLPQGTPGEGSTQGHLAVLQQLLVMPADALGTPLQQLMSPEQRQLTQQYLSQLAQQQALEQQQAALAAAAPGLAQGVTGPGAPGRPPEGGTTPKPGTGQVGENDVIDESLPSSGTPQ